MFDFEDLKSPAEFGHLVGMTDRAYARLGIWCATRVLEGLYSSEDALNVLIEFNRARRKASMDPRVPLHPHKVQVSKLVQVMKVAEVFGEKGVDMLEVFSTLQSEKFITMKYNEELIYNGEFNGMVEIAREALRRGKAMSRKDIIEYVTVSPA